ncbi:Putative concentrative nucleoside transporter domain-containing protein [Septoria linicola]|uniref:Concentrative nucleoside transporter domain-containing protein n=1 Tax=Septoria linicola TaxID=215465 RepID=A0A9Q9ENH0_9PEZI|nr:putative concentrative nucleoside transporter domain-containing protein [Septoria linicola]USW56579.1 Putative concentrative nucleoside transporter domain-containing protein [Septoria linicola]
MEHTHKDPALEPMHQHTHGHLHHGHKAHQDGNDVPTYTVGTTNERSTIPNPSAQDHGISHGPAYGNEKKGDYSVDVEQGNSSPITPTKSLEQSEEGPSKKRTLYRKYRIFVHIAIWLVMTAWWVASVVLHRNNKPWVVPFLIWLAITIRLITLHTGTSYVTGPMRWTWRNTGSRVNQMIPERFRLWAGAAVTFAVILVGSFVSEETEDNTRENRAISLFGMIVLIAGLYATSRNRKAINWHTVISGFLIQYIVALFVLRTGVGYDIFNFISSLARSLLGFAKDGLAFLTSDDFVAETFWFLVTVLPAIIFFVALVQLFYFVGLIQWFVGKFAVFFFWSMRISGAEAVVASATPFIGQGESAMLIKPFVPHLTMCELHQVMTSGFATIAGSVLIAYIGMGLSPQALVSSCVMSIPASLAASKLRYPEEEETLTAGKVVVPDDDTHKAANALHAFANGAWLGLKIAAMILTTLLCIIAFVALINGILTWFGRYINLTGEYDLTIELILGYLFYPIAFLLGVPRGPDLLKVARLIGIKVVTNEFVAFTALTKDALYEDLAPRSRLIATYALCGFGNIGSLGTQIGVLSQIAPGRSGDVSRLAVSALVTGVLATLSSATIAGLVIQDQSGFITPSTAS